MTVAPKKESLILFLGDVLFFLAALWLTLFIRYAEVPSGTLFYNHIVPFSFLFVLFVFVFGIAGLYDKHTILFKKKLPGTIVRAQIANIILAAVFFFFIPYFGITPKTNLLIYLIISSLLIVLWRLVLLQSFGTRKKQRAILIGSGKEAMEVVEEVNNNTRYNLEFVFVADLEKIKNPNDLQKEVLEFVGLGNASVVVCDTRSNALEPLLPLLYNLAFLNTALRFLDIHRVYEDIFSRVPLSLIQYDWFLDNIDHAPKFAYRVIKRAVDSSISLVLGIFSLAVYLPVWLAIYFDDRGPVFISQERVGKNNKLITIWKFRTMTGNDTGDQVLKSECDVTSVGEFLRKTRIDELPQLWSVLKGDLSLIGPRPELPALVHLYGEKIPYYNIRHVIKPGLSGWAQIYHDKHAHHGSDITETKNKLSYDIYYVKNRSLWLDVRIVLRTVKTLLSRSGV